MQLTVVPFWVFLLPGVLDSLPPRGVSQEPTPAAILSGKPLNVLLGQIAAAHRSNRRGPRVPLSSALLRQINLALPGGANFGLLRNGGRLNWPVALTRDRFRKDRDKVGELVVRSLQTLKEDPTKQVPRRVASELETGVKSLEAGLRAEVADLSPSEYLEARRFLNQFREAIQALTGPAAVRFIDGTYNARGVSVEELVGHLRQHSLEFAPAVRGQEKAYQELYRALATYHRGLVPRR
jgi:hypothetical protein